MKFHHDRITCDVTTSGTGRDLPNANGPWFCIDTSQDEVHHCLIELIYSPTQGTLKTPGFFYVDDDDVDAVWTADMAKAKAACKAANRNIAHAGAEWWSRVIRALNRLYGTPDKPHIQKHSVIDAWEGYDKATGDKIESKDLMKDGMLEACRARLARQYTDAEQMSDNNLREKLDKGAIDMNKYGFYGAFGYHRRTPMASILTWNAGDPRRDFRAAFCDA